MVDKVTVEFRFYDAILNQSDLLQYFGQAMGTYQEIRAGQLLFGGGIMNFNSLVGIRDILECY